MALPVAAAAAACFVVLSHLPSLAGSLWQLPVSETAVAVMAEAEETAALRILTLNAWGVDTRLAERTLAAVDGIRRLGPDIVCLQEVFAPSTKAALWAGLGEDYFMFSCDQATPDPYPPLAFLPLAVVCAAVAACWPLSGVVSIVVALALACLLNPWGLFLLLRLFVAKTMKPDLQPQTVLVKRRGATGSGWMAATSVIVRPWSHELRGYPVPGLQQPWLWPEYWVSHCFLRPGLMCVRCSGGVGPLAEALVINVHLVICKYGTLENPARVVQVEEMRGAKKGFFCRNSI